MRTTLFIAVLPPAVLALPPASAQNFNIDFGQPGTGPDSSYAAAGLPGVWNAIEGEHTPIGNPEVVYELVDVNGNPTGVTLHQFGGLELIDVDDPSVSGDDALLLEDALVTHSTTLESCLFIDGLENGTYEVLTYAWMPNSPFTLSRVRHDFVPQTVDVGGFWSGRHQAGRTYARHLVQVTNGSMGSHSGIPPGGNPAIGAALNGIQLRRLVPCPADVNGDDTVNVQDLVEVILHWGQAGGAADVNADGSVNVQDLLELILAWGSCP